MREKAFMNSFGSIKAFAVSKGLVMGNNKAQGGEEIANYIKTAYLERLENVFNWFKNRSLTNS